MASTAARRATRGPAPGRIGLSLLVLFGGIGLPLGADLQAGAGPLAPPNADRLSRAELIERVLRYHPHPDSGLRARTQRALSGYGTEQFATRTGDGCTDATTSAPSGGFE